MPTWTVVGSGARGGAGGCAPQLAADRHATPLMLLDDAGGVLGVMTQECVGMDERVHGPSVLHLFGFMVGPIAVLQPHARRRLQRGAQGSGVCLPWQD